MGSKIGWIAAGGIVVIVAVVIIIFGFGSSHSPPRDTLKQGMLDLKTIDVQLLADVVGYRPSGAGNAGDDYHTAADLAERDPSGWHAIAADVAAGAGKRECRYVFVHTPQTLDVDVGMGAVERLRTVATVLSEVADRHTSAGDWAGGESIFRSLLVFGWHVQTDRGHIQCVATGLEIQRIAWFGLRGIYARPGGRDDGRLDALRRYETAAVDLSSFYRRKRQIVWADDVWAGDLFHVIAHDADFAWRVQAVLAMGRGRSKFKDVDARHAERLLDAMAHGDEPILAAAARAARNHTPSQKNP